MENSKIIMISLLTITAILSALLLFGCTAKEPLLEEYHQDTGSLVVGEGNEGDGGPVDDGTDLPSEPENFYAVKCIISGTEYYMKDMFIYSENGMGYSYVKTPIGEYSMFNGQTWRLEIYRNKNNSYYNKTLSYIGKGIAPDGSPVVCGEVDSVPARFRTFYDNHIDIFTGNMTKADDGMVLVPTGL